LGLTIAQSYIQQHRGTLRLESHEGKTTAEVRLPAIVD
jgi:nitrogen-specific signal transduction histidine kinase